MGAKIIGAALASTAINGALAAWVLALRRRLSKERKEAEKKQNAGIKRTNSEMAMASSEVMQPIAWQQYGSFTCPSALLEEKKYYAAVEETARLRALNKKLMAQVEQLEDTLRQETLSKRESNDRRVEELEEQLREANEMLAVMEQDYNELMMAVAEKQDIIVCGSASNSLPGNEESENLKQGFVDSDEDHFSPRTPDVAIDERTEYFD